MTPVYNRGFFDGLEEGYARKANILLWEVVGMSSLRKLLFASLGLLDLTKEKAEQLVRDLVERGEMTREEGNDLLTAMLRRMDTEKEEMLFRFRKEAGRLMTSMGVASKDQVQELRLRVENLEQQLRQAEAEPEADREQGKMDQ